MWLHVDMKAGRTALFQPPMAQRIEMMAEPILYCLFLMGQAGQSAPNKSGLSVSLGRQLADNRWRAFGIQLLTLAEKPQAAATPKISGQPVCQLIFCQQKIRV